MDVGFSITLRQHRRSLHNVSEAIPEDAWKPIPYWMDGAADVAETTYIPFQNEPDAAPLRLIAPAGEAHARFPDGPLRHLQLSRLHHRLAMGRCSNWRPIIAFKPRSRMRYATSRTVSD